MADVDQLARQLTVAMVTNLARRGMVLAAGVALVTFLVGGLSYLTGLAALDGSAGSAWTVIGGAMLIVAVGAPAAGVVAAVAGRQGRHRAGRPRSAA